MENQRKERKGFKKVFLMILLLLVTVGTLTTVTYAWWNSLQKDKTVKVPVGEGVEILVSPETLSNVGELVPSGQKVLKSQTEKITIKYTVGARILDADGENLNFDEFENYSLRVTVVNKINPHIVIKVGDTNINKDGSEYLVAVTSGTTIPVEVELTLDMDKTTDPNVVKEIKNTSLSFILSFELVSTPESE